MHTHCNGFIVDEPNFSDFPSLCVSGGQLRPNLVVAVEAIRVFTHIKQMRSDNTKTIHYTLLVLT